MLSTVNIAYCMLSTMSSAPNTTFIYTLFVDNTSYMSGTSSSYEHCVYFSSMAKMKFLFNGKNEILIHSLIAQSKHYRIDCSKKALYDLIWSLS